MDKLKFNPFTGNFDFSGNTPAESIIKAIVLPDGNSLDLALLFQSDHATGMFKDSNGMNLLSQGRKWTLTQKGIETYLDANAWMSIGDSNQVGTGYAYVFGSYS